MAMENSTQATTVNPNQQPPVFREQQPSLREIQGLFGNISQNPRSVKALYGAVGGTQGIPWPNDLHSSPFRKATASFYYDYFRTCGIFSGSVRVSKH